MTRLIIILIIVISCRINVSITREIVNIWSITSRTVMYGYPDDSIHYNINNSDLMQDLLLMSIVILYTVFTLWSNCTDYLQPSPGWIRCL